MGGGPHDKLIGYIARESGATKEEAEKIILKDERRFRRAVDALYQKRYAQKYEDSDKFFAAYTGKYGGFDARVEEVTPMVPGQEPQRVIESGEAPPALRDPLTTEEAQFVQNQQNQSRSGIDPNQTFTPPKDFRLPNTDSDTYMGVRADLQGAAEVIRDPIEEPTTYGETGIPRLRSQDGNQLNAGIERATSPEQVAMTLYSADDGYVNPIYLTRAGYQSFINQASVNKFGNDDQGKPVTADRLTPEMREELFKDLFKNYVDEEGRVELQEKMGVNFDASPLEHAVGTFMNSGADMLSNAAASYARYHRSQDAFDAIRYYKKHKGNLPEDFAETNPEEFRKYNFGKSLEAGGLKDYLDSINREITSNREELSTAIRQTLPAKASLQYEKNFLLTDLPAAAASAAVFSATGGNPVAIGALGGLANENVLREEAQAAGADYETQVKAAGLGFLIGVSEATFGRITGRAFGAGRTGSLPANIVRSSGEEFTQEFFQANLNELTAQELYDTTRELFSSKTFREGFAGAASGGATVGLVRAPQALYGAISQQMMSRYNEFSEEQLNQLADDLADVQEEAVVIQEESRIDKELEIKNETLKQQKDLLAKAGVDTPLANNISQEANQTVEEINQLTEARKALRGDAGPAADTESIATEEEAQSSQEQTLPTGPVEDITTLPEDNQFRELSEAEVDGDRVINGAFKSIKIRMDEDGLPSILVHNSKDKGNLFYSIDRFGKVTNVNADGTEAENPINLNSSAKSRSLSKFLTIPNVINKGYPGIISMTEDSDGEWNVNISEDMTGEETPPAIRERLVEELLQVRRNFASSTTQNNARRALEQKIIELDPSQEFGRRSPRKESEIAIPATEVSEETGPLDTSTPEGATVNIESNVDQSPSTSPTSNAYATQVNNLVRSGKNPAAVQAVLSAVQSNQITPESEAAFDSLRDYDSVGGRRVPRAIKNSLLSDYTALKSSNRKASRDAEQQDRQAIVSIQQTSLREAGVGPMIERMAKNYKQAFRKGDPQSVFASMQRDLGALVFDEVQLGERPSRDEIFEAFDQALNSHPDVKDAFNKVREVISNVFTDQDASDFGFDSVDQYASAVASNLVFGEKAFNASGKATVSISSPESKWRIKHLAERIYDKELKQAMREARNMSQLGFRASSVVEGEATPEDRSPDMILASKVFLDRILKTLSPLFPDISVVYDDQAAFDQAASDALLDPARTKGFYYDGSIYFNPSTVTQDTPLHEFAHVWLLMLRNSTEGNPIYKRLAKEVKKLRVFEQTQTEMGENASEDAVIQEALAKVIGVEATNRYKKQTKRYGIPGNSTLAQRIDRLISKMWDKVLEALNLTKSFIINRLKIHNIDVSGRKIVDLADMNLSDLINVAGRELLSGSQLAVIQDLDLPEFGKLQLVRHQLKEKTWSVIEEKVKTRGRRIYPKVEGGFDSLRIGFQDNRVVLRKIQEFIDDKLVGGNISQETDIDTLLDLMPGKVRHTVESTLVQLVGDDSIRSRGAREATRERSLMGRLASKGIAWKDFSLYLYAKHARERNAYLRQQRLEDLQNDLDEGKIDQSEFDTQSQELTTSFLSGMQDTTAAEIVAKAEQGEQAQWYEWGQRLFKEIISTPTRQMMLNAGLIDQATLNTLDGTFENYIPLFVLDYTTAEGEGRSTPGQRAMSVRGAGLRPLRGSQRHEYWNRVDPIIGAIRQYASVVHKAEMNRVAQQMGKLVEQNPDPDLWEVRNAPRLLIKNESGEIFSSIALPDLKGWSKDGENAIDFLQDGKRKQILIKDKGLYQAFIPNKSVEAGGNIRAGWSIYRAFQFWRRNLMTKYNPSFGVAQFPADLLTSLLFIDGAIPGVESNLQVKLMGNIRNAAKAQFAFAKGNNLTSEEGRKMSNYIAEMIAAGGEISFIDHEKMEATVKGFDKEVAKSRKRLNDAGGNKFFQLPRKASDTLFNTIELYNRVSEQTIRLATYATAREAGKSPQEAAKAAKNITVNFNTKGQWSWLTNVLYLFSNAGIQGTAMSLHYLKHSPKVRRNFAAAFGLGLLISLLGDLFDEEEDRNDLVSDEEDRYEARYKIPGTDLVFKHRLGYGFNIPWHAGKSVSDMLTGKVSGVKAGAHVISNIANTLNPLDASQGLAYMVMPDIAKPLYELHGNTTFGGRPIRPEAVYGPAPRASRNHFPNVNTMSKSFAYWLGDAVGGGEGDIGGWAEVNPENIDYVSNYLFGGFGSFMGNAGQSLQMALSPLGEDSEEFNVNRLIIARRFFEDNTKKTWREQSYFYDQYKSANQKGLNDYELSLTRFSYESLKAEKSKSRKKTSPNERRSIDRSMDLLKRKYKELLSAQYKRRVKNGNSTELLEEMAKRENIRLSD